MIKGIKTYMRQILVYILYKSAKKLYFQPSNILHQIVRKQILMRLCALDWNRKQKFLEVKFNFTILLLISKS